MSKNNQNQDLANMEVSLELEDSHQPAGASAIKGDEGSLYKSSVIVVSPLAAGEETQIYTLAKNAYAFDFDLSQVSKAALNDGNLIIDFTNGGSAILYDFENVYANSETALFEFQNDLTRNWLLEEIGLAQNVVKDPLMPSEEDLEEPQSEIREMQIEDNLNIVVSDDQADILAGIKPAAGIGADSTAENLAAIEPAAGDDNAPAGALSSGYGFNSSFSASDLSGIDDVGPIDPTALQYGVNFREGEVFDINEQVGTPEQNDTPVITATGREVDETNFATGGNTVSGQIIADFGVDAPGTIEPNGVFTVGGSVAGGDLHSGGSLVTVTAVAGGYIGIANGQTVFTLTVDPVTGDYTYSQFLPFDHADGTNPDDLISLVFGVDATDNDGDTTASAITIDVRDDAPATAAPAFETINESGLNAGAIAVSGQLIIDFGQDGAGSVSPDGVSTVTGAVTGGSLYSAGEDVIITATANGYIGQTVGGADVFTLTIDPLTGDYTFTLIRSIDHTNAGDIITLNFGVDVVDYDQDTTDTSISIDIVDSTPSVHVPDVGGATEWVDETDLANAGAQVRTGNVTVDFGSDTPGTFGGTGVATNTLTSNGQSVVVTYDATTMTYTGTINGGTTTIFTLELTGTGGYRFTLEGPVDHPDSTNPDDALVAEFGVVVTDSDGDTAIGTIRIGIADDGPVAHDDFVSFDQDLVSVSGDVDLNDDPGADAPASVTAISNGTTTSVVASGGSTTITGTYGTLVINADGTYTYTLNPGHLPDEAIDRFTYTYTDADGDSDTAVLKIVGLNDDVPQVVSVEAVTVDETNITDIETGSIIVDFGADAPGTISGTGTYDLHGLTSGGQSIAVSFDSLTNTYAGTIDGGATTIFTLEVISTGSYRFTLEGPVDHADASNPNDGVTIEFGALATDSDGDTAPITLSVTINDDGPSAYAPAVNMLDETNLDVGNLIGSGTVGHDFGADGAGQVVTNNSFTVDGLSGLTSDGSVVTVRQNVTGDGYIATDALGRVVFTLTIDPATGFYTYTQERALDHPDATDHNDSLFLNFGFDVIDNDGDSARSAIRIEIADDGPIANRDFFNIGQGQTMTGNVMDNDDVGADVDGSITSVNYNGVDYAIAPGQTLTLPSGTGHFTISSDGTYSFTATTPYGDYLFYTLTDADGDTSVAKLYFTAQPSLFKVGENVDDASGSTTPYRVGGGSEEILGDIANDILVGDVGNSQLMPQEKDYNVVLILDISGSMGAATPGTKFTLLQQAVNNLLADLNTYASGDIKVHIVPFGTVAFWPGTFTVTDLADLANAQAFINGMGNNGYTYTNYEDAMTAALMWLNSSDPISGAETTTYFVSDGEPNRYVDSSNVVRSANAATAMGEVLGTDGTNEVADLQSFGDVVAVGIGVNSTTISRLGLIDSDGSAIDVQNPADLNSTFQNLNPINTLNDVGDDYIFGGDGDDIIFGDAMYTDVLAADHGLTLPAGSGWEVFAALEATPGWDRDDTLDYIRNHAEELAQESVTTNGHTRSGGEDHLSGGAGDDLIFGQEGRDWIEGGAGSDDLFGGSDGDVFIYTQVSDAGDTIHDFSQADGDMIDVSDLLQGYDSTQHSINDFVFTTEVGGNTIISVDVDGASGPASAFNLLVIEGVTGLDIAVITNNGEQVI